MHGIDQPLYGSLLRRLALLGCGSDDDSAMLLSCCSRVRQVHRGECIARKGERLGQTHVILQGWAADCNVALDGRRRITAILVPGDFGDVLASGDGKRDGSLMAITECVIAAVPVAEMQDLVRASAKLAVLFRQMVSTELAVMRRWLLRDSRGSALQALGHFLCEFQVRTRSLGLGNDTYFPLPLTQTVVGDATGMTAVHVNRTLQRIKEAGLATVDRGGVYVHDIQALQRISGFVSDYLQPMVETASV